MKKYTYFGHLNITNDGYELSFYNLSQIKAITGINLPAIIDSAKDTLARTVSNYIADNKELPERYSDLGFWDFPITVTSDDIRMAHQEAFRVDIFHGGTCRHVYFEDYSDAIRFAKGNANLNTTVFLLEHLLDGYYDVKEWVKVNEN